MPTRTDSLSALLGALYQSTDSLPPCGEGSAVGDRARLHLRQLRWLGQHVTGCGDDVPSPATMSLAVMEITAAAAEHGARPSECSRAFQAGVRDGRPSHETAGEHCTACAADTCSVHGDYDMRADWEGTVTYANPAAEALAADRAYHCTYDGKRFVPCPSCGGDHTPTWDAEDAAFVAALRTPAEQTAHAAEARADWVGPLTARVHEPCEGCGGCTPDVREGRFDQHSPATCDACWEKWLDGRTLAQASAFEQDEHHRHCDGRGCPRCGETGTARGALAHAARAPYLAALVDLARAAEDVLGAWPTQGEACGYPEGLPSFDDAAAQISEWAWIEERAVACVDCGAYTAEPFIGEDDGANRCEGCV